MIRYGTSGLPTRVCGVWAVVAVFAVGGCSRWQVVDPVRLQNASLGPMTIAVAPALNVSGSADLDSNRVADLMASELSYVDGITVIPVNRVLAVLADQGRDAIESPGHALEVAKILGADAILVFAITEFDPYDPPVAGIAAQLYGRRRTAHFAAFDPVLESRIGAPSGYESRGAPMGALAEFEQVFDASHEWVSAEVKRFAQSRSEAKSPFGWRVYLASQQRYLRFCCHETIRALMSFAGPKDGAAVAG